MTTLEYNTVSQGRTVCKDMTADAAERRMRSSERVLDLDSDVGEPIIPPSSKHPYVQKSRRIPRHAHNESPFTPGRNTFKQTQPKAVLEPMKPENFYGTSSGAESSTHRTSTRQSQPHVNAYSYKDKGKGKEVVEVVDEEPEMVEEPVEASSKDVERWQRARKARTETAEDIQSFSDVEKRGLPTAGPSGAKRKRVMKDRDGNVAENGQEAASDKTAIFRPGSKTANISSPLPLAVVEAYLDGAPFPISTLTISPQKHILFTGRTGCEWKQNVDELGIKLPRNIEENPGKIFALTFSRAQAVKLGRSQNLEITSQVERVDLLMKLDSNDQKHLAMVYHLLRKKNPKSVETMELQALEKVFETESLRPVIESSPDPLAAMPTSRRRPASTVARMQRKPRTEADEVQIVDRPPTPPRAPVRNASRRSARHSGTSAVEPEDIDGGFQLMPKPSKRCADPHKLLFKYPIDGRGGISVTDGDRDRMRNEEYLNDTLIEFGLKLIFAELSEEEKKRVHIFNSFFYKKLTINRSAKRRRNGGDEAETVAPDHWEGYEAVKKWTVKSKVDIFDKDLVIVPINEHLHWYLAVIYNPKGILKEGPAPDPPPSPPKRTRAQAAGGPDVERTPPPVMSPPEAPKASIFGGLLNLPFGFLAGSAPEPATPDDEVSVPPASEISEMPCGQDTSTGVADKMEEMQIQPTIVDSDDEDYKGEPLNTRTTQRIARGKAGSVTPPPLSVEEVIQAKKPKKVIERKKIWGHEGAWILVFDSLGSNHPAVGRNLGKWLEYEARERRGVTYPMTAAEHFDVKSGLTQPNGWDCGVYALYTAERIMKHPQQVISFSERPQPLVSADREWHNERKRVWSDDDVRTKRQEWTMRIDSLKDEYAEQMAAKSEVPTATPAPEPVESSILPDDERVDPLQAGPTIDPAIDPADSLSVTAASMSDSDVEAAVATCDPTRQPARGATPQPEDELVPGQVVIEQARTAHAENRRRCIDQSRADKVEEDDAESPDPEPPIPSMDLDHDELLAEEDDAVVHDMPGRDITIPWSQTPVRTASPALSKPEEKEEVEQPSSRAGSAINPDLTASRPSCSPPPPKRARATSPVEILSAQKRKAGSKHTKARVTKHVKKKGGTAAEPLLIDDSDEE